MLLIYESFISHEHVQVVWGRISMVDAERRLLSNALKDVDNQHFVLLSDRYMLISVGWMD